MTQPARDERPGTALPPEFFGVPVQVGGPYAQPAAFPGVPAPLGDRFLARLIDGGVLIGWLLVIRVFTLGVSLDRGGARAALVSLLFLVPYFGYEFSCTGRWGQTLGKRVMRLRVLRETGAPAGWGAAALRVYVPMLAGFLTCGFGSLLCYLSPLFDQAAWQRGWYDRVAKTVVVKQ
ncbi:putative RDD family membrane protein YckC [Asanoa ferruginea]|uniref:Putative RDD family membrane protein YckC n=1 Tax=Asanoa ferruginea TaxID=53367 RepID=A0A3D9ZLM0_9ACTN|nr:RDD family protein [Asanoa ferruginea]REF98107.1 putative RDD family membrane protein YckC [Asanoa ferruginea]